MKKVIISIHPKWCELIFNGQKTIEVRKSFPRQLEPPFEVLVYETKGQFIKSVKGACTTYGYGRGKVIGSFVCDKVYKIVPDGEYYSDGYDIDDDRLAETCLTREQLREYGKGVTLYGWHITEPKLFDKPKELGKFFVPCKKYNDSELHCMRWDCEHYSFFPGANGDAEEECLCKGRKPLRRPPQSWCYVEDK